jgi:hypothetical protein
MRIACITILCIFLISCSDKRQDDGIERLYRKSLQTSSFTLDWFFYSTFSNITPDYVITKRGNRSDTLCFANNVADIYVVDSNKVHLSFYGTPWIYGEPAHVSSPDYIIAEIDTNSKVNSPYAKKFFKKS